jgi:hypothetical protein
MRFARVAAFVIGSMQLWGCGGGSGAQDAGNDTGFAPSAGPGDVDGYFPLDPSARWSYASASVDPSGRLVESVLTAQVTGTKSVLGVDATILTFTDDSSGSLTETYWLSSGGGVTNLGTNDTSDVVTRALVPYVQLHFPVRLGTVAASIKKGVIIATDREGHPVLADLQQTVLNDAFEAISVTAGSFPTALKQRTTIHGDVSSQGQSIGTIDSTETDWLVPGVGLIKRTLAANSVLGGTTETQNEAEGLQGYLSKGKRHGLGSAFTIISGPSTPSSNLDQPSGALAVATDGTNFFVVSRLANGGGPSGYLVKWVGTLIGSDGGVGTTVDLSPTLVITSLDVDPYAAVAFDGTNYLVVYQDPGNTSQGLYGLQVSSAGVPLEAASRLADSRCFGNSQGCPAPVLAFDGTRFLLVYIQSPNDLDQVEGLFVSPADGHPVGSPFPISPAPGYPRGVDVAFGGGDYLVVWNQDPWTGQDSGLFGQRLDTSGSLVATPFPLVPASARYADPALGFDGTNFLAVFLDQRVANGISGVRISTQGTVLESPSFVFTTDPNDLDYAPRPAFLGGEYWVAWARYLDPGQYAGLWGNRLSTAGQVAVPGPVGVPLAIASPVTPSAHGFAAGKDQALLVWLDLDPVTSAPEIRANLIAPSGP